MARLFVIGDPQGPFAKVLDVLDAHRALDGDRLAADIVLVSIGDHFDYDLRDPRTAAREGVQLVRWLASHDPAQVKLLLGNHDASRVMELAGFTDDAFEAARVLARAVDEGERSAGEFLAAYPDLPPHGVIGRDYASYTTEQRALVIELLLAGRFQLALAGTLGDGRAVLLTHAGVTARELAMLGLPAAREPVTIAAALDAHLAAAVGRVRGDWERGVTTPLSLEPLHVTGGRGEEGGGLLYHRPSNPDAREAAAAWAPARPRRFDPRTLPVGLTQIVGHSGHAKCVHELGPWASAAAHARKHGGIRTLRFAGGDVTYDLGIAPALADVADVADVVMIDGELRRVPASDVALLPLAALA